MTLKVEDVQKVLNSVKEFVNFAVVFVPEGKVKVWVEKGRDVISTPSLSEVIVDGFKLYDEVKAIVVK